jgi:hypothetical protein
LAIYIYKQGSQATPLISVPNSKKSKESTAYDSGWSTSFPCTITENVISGGAKLPSEAILGPLMIIPNYQQRV